MAKGRTTKVLLCHMPVIDTKFQCVTIDLIGEISPGPERGNCFVLTLFDYAIRYPEAIVLKDEKAETVAKVLVGTFSREVLCDQCPQLTAGMMKKVSCLWSVKQLVTTLYHPMFNGLVERLNGMLKIFA